MTFSPDNLIYFLLGGALSIYLAKRFARQKRAFYWIDTVPIFSSKSIEIVDGFEVSFRGQRVQSVRQHSIFFWNSGNETILNFDVSEERCLKFGFAEGSQITLDKVIFKSDNPDFQFDRKDHQLYFQYKFIEPGDGFWIIVLEATIDGNDPHDPSLEGHIVGLTEPLKKLEPVDTFKAKFNLQFGIGCLGLFLALVFSLLFFGAVRINIWPPTKEWFFGIVLFLMMALVTDVFGLMDFLKHSRHRVPRGFSASSRYKYRPVDPLIAASDEAAGQVIRK